MAACPGESVTMIDEANMTTSASPYETRPEHGEKPQCLFGSRTPLTATLSAALLLPAMMVPRGTIPFEIETLPLNMESSHGFLANNRYEAAPRRAVFRGPPRLKIDDADEFARLASSSPVSPEAGHVFAFRSATSRSPAIT